LRQNTVKLNKTKKLLIAILVTNLFCTFFGGHGGAPLGLLELGVIYSTVTLNFDVFPFLSFWTLAAFIMLVGQVVVLVGLRKNDLIDTVHWGRFGTLLLILPLIVVAVGVGEEFLTATLITSSPFLVLTIVFWWTTRSCNRRQFLNKE
jgi:hypothetical protein